ncbi:hypothetical protein VE04_07868 [Pseudogymnoascus sp. 24MN13]|nr:hypothetical protein VE04_07868 [Pseudogymnoascus sp. 24MN13]
MRYYYSLFGSWAGDNIVCASDEILPGDYPPGLFSAKEEEDMDKKFLVLIYGSDGYYDDSDFEYGEGGEDGAEQLTLHNLSKSPGTWFYEEFFVERESTRVFGACLSQSEFGRERCRIVVFTGGSSVDSAEPDD